MRNDPSRLRELRRCLILDSAAERVYDDLVGLLAAGLEVPIAMVSLLDETRDWFKSSVGVPFQESPAATSFCERFFHTTKDLILVEDTAKDPLFAAHPLVVNAPFIRFYVAARLDVDGRTLGTLCAYDVKPRAISAEQVEQVRALALTAIELLKQRSRAAA